MTRHATVEAQRDEARAQAASANQALAVSQAEVRMGEEALKRMKEQFESERGTLRELIESAQGRHEELQARGHAESLERERAEAAAMAAQNEKRLLQELSSQVQQQVTGRAPGTFRNLSCNGTSLASRIPLQRRGHWGGALSFTALHGACMA